MSLRSTLNQFLDTFVQNLTTVVNQSADATERRIVREMRDYGAISADRAQPFRGATPKEKRAFLHLMERGAIRQPNPGRYYVDLKAAQRWL